MMILGATSIAVCPSSSYTRKRKGDGDDGGVTRVTSGKLFFYYHFFFVFGLLVLVLLPKNSAAYYVGPEVGKAPGEARSVKTRGFGFGNPNNATSLAEAAYVPYVYSVGNNIVTFLRSIIPALQSKVDFFAEQIQDTIDTTNEVLMQKLENSNNGIIAAENFFTGLMKAVVLGKGPEDEEERRRRLAVALINSGMLRITTTSPTTPLASTATTTTKGISITTKRNIATTKPTTTRSTTTAKSTTRTTTVGTTTGTTTPASPGDIASNPTLASQKARDNNFNKMKVINIVKNLV